MKQLLLLPFTLLLAPLVIVAADSATPASSDTSTTATDNTADTPSPAGNSDGNTASPAVEGPLSRWLQLNTLSFGMRYRNTADFDGMHLFDYGQERSLIDGALKLDAQGKYAVHFHVSSGRYFDWAYADEIGGNFAQVAPKSLTEMSPSQQQLVYTAVPKDFAFFELTQASLHSNGWQMYVRQLYLSASPVKEFTAEYGALPIEHGVNTEMTTYDDDGYMEGGRIRIKDPKHLFFDQYVVTFGYVGDIYSPNVFERGERFGQSNYHQFLIEKKLKGHFDATVDYTEHFGAHVMREALLLNTKKYHAVDSVRGEFYQRTNDVTLQTMRFGGGSGWGVTAARNVTRKWHLEGGFASVDKNYTVLAGHAFLVAVGNSLNGDQYSVGNRFFGRAAYNIVPGVKLFGYYSHIVDTNFMTLNGQGCNAGIDLNLKELVNRQFHLFQ